MFLAKDKAVYLLLIILFTLLVSTAAFAQICTGPVSGGISVDYDTSGNVYAVRCTTGGDFRIYKSTNGGSIWFDIATVDAPLGSSYPVIFTGSTGNKLYLFYLRSSQNGDIWMARLTQSGVLESSYEVKVDTDTITYFSACVDYENGNHFMAAYQKETPSPAVYTITSTDYGETWGNQLFFGGLRAHPDIAYGRNGYVYLVFEYTGGAYSEIEFIRSRNYGELGSWEYSKYLTTGSDSGDNTYPKVAALHTLPDSTPYVWVAYNHENPAGTDIDLRYAYSSYGGKDYWYTNRILDSSSAYHEMACDLWTKRSPDYEYVNVCYFVGRYVEPFPHGHIFYGQASATHPTDWGWLHEVSYYWPTQSEDGRKICQGTYAQGNCAIIWAGKEPLDQPFGDDFQNLLFNAWSTDVEEEVTEGEVPTKFSLSANYPNPFNPVTRIQYTVGSKQTWPIHTTLRIYNVLGQLVRTLVDEPKEAGTYEVIWDGKDGNGNEVASGIYFYRLKAGDFAEARKMLLVK